MAAAGLPEGYRIRVRGRLGAEWSTWFDGLTVEAENGETILSGPVRDQAALFGLLARVQELGLPLLSIAPLEPDLPDGSERSGRPRHLV